MKTLKKILKFSLVTLIILTIFIGRKFFFDIFRNTASADAPMGGGGSDTTGDTGGGGGSDGGGGGSGGAGDS